MHEDAIPRTTIPPPQTTAGDPVPAVPLRRPQMQELDRTTLGGLLGALGNGGKDHAETAIEALKLALVTMHEDLVFWRARAIELEGKLEASRT